MELGFDRVIRKLESVRRDRLMMGLAVLVAEIFLLVAYATQPATRITNPWPMVYPLVWIDVSFYVLYRVWQRRSTAASARRRWIAGVLSTGYFLVLGHFGGLYGWFGTSRGLTFDFQLPPGASPALLYSGHPWVVVLQPYKVLGYLTLTYLVYRTILYAAGSAGSAISGVVSLFSCVSCSWPLIGLVASAFFGGTSAIAAVALTHDYLLSTAIFLSSVGLLYWQPSFNRNPIRILAS